MYIVNDMMSSNFLATNSKATYVRYNKVGKVMTKNRGPLPLLKCWVKRR